MLVMIEWLGCLMELRFGVMVSKYLKERMWEHCRMNTMWCIRRIFVFAIR